ncbi:serine/threonine-protein kinase [Hyalangium gracile]|uniref:serine/threonine-protein kinase n=1 Tax=Hyalangium gracile TaxID=394092 RepID=UPI001CCA6A0B|nr:serine/threonine-protein kinase [Hyalangium gracile]
MSAQPDPSNLPPGTSIQAWRVVAKLGQGSYGAVYHVQLEGQDFALKIAHHRAGSADTARTDARIRRELACLSLVNHPHIVRVWSHGRWSNPREGFFFLVEDYVEGYTLAEWMEHAQPTFRQVAALMESVADALEVPHKQGIFHRDLKPSNILVRKKDDAPVITDFSVGDHPLAEDLTEGPIPPGTRRYRSPEALRFERQHPHPPEARYAFQVTDELFALGATLYDILTDPLPTGRHPRLPLNNDALPPPSPIKVNPRVPPALSDLTMALLDPNPHLRPPSVGALRRMLGELKADPGEAWDALVYPPLARRTAASPPPEARKDPRRPWWPWVAVLGAAVLALLLAAILFAARADPPTESPAAHAPQQPSLGSTSPLSQKETNAVSNSRSTPEASSPVTAEPKPQQPQLPIPPKPSLKRCAALAGALAFLEVGCATVQLRPEPGECPDNAIKAMRKFHQPNMGMAAVRIWPDARRKGDTEGLGAYENGPITGVFDLESSPDEFPDGTLLDGHLWVSAPGDRIFGRFTRARLPDGSSVPLCMELCENEDDWGIHKRGPGPREGTVMMYHHVGACFTDRWH